MRIKTLEEKNKRRIEIDRKKIDLERIAIDRGRLALDEARLQLERDKFCADALTKEYQSRSVEIMFHSSRYHKQVNFIQLYLTVLGSFFAILFSKDWSIALNSIQKIDITYVQTGLILTAYLISLYLFTNVMDSLFMIYGNAGRLAAIERNINLVVGREVLLWDSEIIPRLLNMDRPLIGVWIRPNILLAAWSFLFFIGVSVALCWITYYVGNKVFYYFTPPAIFISCLLILNWVLLTTDGVIFIDAAVNRKPHLVSAKWAPAIFILANVLLAYLPMVLFSLRDNAFFWDAQGVVFPFLSIPSIWLGDLILIPIFNYFSIMWLRTQKDDFRYLLRVSLVSILLAVLITSTQHWIWVNDQWSGFMDLQHGILSAAGWVHFFYSAIQISLVITVVVVFFATWRRHLIGAFTIVSARQCGIAIISLLVFTSISLCDWYIRNVAILSQTYEAALVSDWQSFIPFSLCLCFSIIAFRRFKKIFHAIMLQANRVQ